MRVSTLAFLAALAALSPAGAQVDLTGSDWLAEDILGAGVVDRVRSTFQALPDGRVAGSSGCNRFAGKGIVSGGKVAIGTLATTRMACPEALMNQETRYLKALAASTRYEIGGDGLLRFYDETGTVTVRFSRLK